MTRSTQEVFDSHQEALETGDFAKLAADYAEDAILLTLDRSYIGREAIVKDFFQMMFGQFTNPVIHFDKTAVEGDVFLLQWSAVADEGTIPHGTGVFIIRDGLIQRQGEWFEIVLKEG
jgi:ketosteroid isomerase-like protein